MKKTILLTLIFLTAATTAWANVPLMPVILILGLPISAFIITTGQAFALIVLIETVILKRLEGISLVEALKLSFFANVFSSFIGFCATVTYSSSVTLIIGVPLGSLLFVYLFISFSKSTEFLTGFSKNRLLCVVSFICLALLAAFLGALTIPGHTYNPTRTHFSDNYEIIIAIAGAAGLIAIGFVLSFISEGYVISRLISKKRPELAMTVLKINLISYAVLITISAYFITEMIYDKNWFWHR